MEKKFLTAVGDHFEINGSPVRLTGWALGSWMNFEHFMIGFPGTNSMIIDAFERVYGKDRADEFVDKLLHCMFGEDDIRYLKNLGINTLRIPFGYHYFMDDQNPFVFNERGFEQLDRVVKLCEKYEIFTILDLHSTPGSQNTDWHSDNITGQSLFWRYKVFRDETIWLWGELSKRYADNEWVAGYDILNEPGFDVTANEINDFYETALKQIRRYDKNHIVFLEGTDFGRDFHLLKHFDDPQIAYTVHFYPFVLEENMLDPKMDPKHRFAICKSIFERQIEPLKKYGRPIWCGESGYEIIDEQEEFYSKLLLSNIKICEQEKISWNLWTYKDARIMGIVVPKAQSGWIKLTEKIAKKWSHHREERISMSVTRGMGEKYYARLSDELAYELDFQVRSVLHRIAVETVLIPELKNISWEEMIKLPEDFLFSNCDQRSIVTNSIKHRLLEGRS